jgi:hypothetical protein
MHAQFLSDSQATFLSLRNRRKIQFGHIDLRCASRFVQQTNFAQSWKFCATRGADKIS